MRPSSLFVLASLCATACGTTPPAPEPERAAQRIAPPAAESPVDRVLDIPARDQAPERPETGWCAETAIQEAMLYFGAYAPQRDINRAGSPRNPDLYWDDVPVALDALGLESTRWSGRGGQSKFTAWVRERLHDGHPVIAGVKLYPTEHPRWGLDHIVLIVGAEKTGALLINTTWGWRTRRSKSELASTDEGISLANRSGRQFAYAVTGFSSERPWPRVRLRVVGESKSAIEAEVHATGLIEGSRYELRRIDSAGDVVARETFEAGATSDIFPVALDPGEPAQFEVHPRRARSSAEDSR